MVNEVAMIGFLAFVAGVSLGYVVGQVLPLKERVVRVPYSELYPKSHTQSPPVPPVSHV